MFLDRTQAGQDLAEALLSYKEDGPVVLAIPRGGVLVGVEVAKALDCPLSLVVPRKIGAPNNPELAIGAVAGPDQLILNESLKVALRVSDTYLKAEVERQLSEVRRREERYLGAGPRPELTGRTVIIVDDGLATGFTAMAAVAAVRVRKPGGIVFGAPVGSDEAVKRLKPKVEEIVCLMVPEDFLAVGEFYVHFEQVSDEEVIQIVRGYRAALGQA